MILTYPHGKPQDLTPGEWRNSAAPSDMRFSVGTGVPAGPNSSIEALWAAAGWGSPLFRTTLGPRSCIEKRSPALVGCGDPASREGTASYDLCNLLSNIYVRKDEVCPKKTGAETEQANEESQNQE